MNSRCDRLLDNKYVYPLLLALVFTVSILIQWFALPGIDQSWFALMTRRMLDGVALYKDFFEPNMPLITWIYAAPVALSEKLPVHPVVAVKLFTVAIIALCLIVYAQVLRHSSLWTEKQRRSLLLAIAVLLLLSAHTYIVFAQREHWLIILTLPYVLLNLPSVRQKDFSSPALVGLGALAATGFCLKPYYFILWLAVLGYRFFRARSWRVLFGPAEITIACMTALYVAGIALFTPYYFGYIRIVSQFYGDAGFTGETWLGKVVWFALVAGVGALVARAFKLFSIDPAAPYRSECVYLLWIAVGGYIEGLAQFKTWAYTPYPFMVLGMLAVLAVILLKPRNDLLSLALLGFMFYPILPIDNTYTQTELRKYDRVMQKAVMPHEHSRDLYFISLINPPVMFFRADSPLSWAGKFNHLFEVGAIMNRSPHYKQPTLTAKPGKEQVERWMLDNIADDL